VEIKESGGKCEYRHNGFTSFNAVYELLSKQARKVKAALKPAKDAKGTAKVAKAPRVTQKQRLALLQNDNQKLVQVVQSFDPQHPILSEINVSILPETQPKPDLKQQKRARGATAKKAGKAKEATVVTPDAIPDQVGGEDRLAA
jgi:hypothetical protein